jgi:hypothetical protein
MAPEIQRQFMTAVLQDHLYLNFYCRGVAAPLRLEEERNSTTDAAYIAALSRANQGKGCWSEAWQCAGVNGDEVLVRQADLTLHVRKDQVRQGVSSLASPGALVDLRFPKEFATVSPGFYVAIGDRDLALADWTEAVRFYWNVTGCGAARLMEFVTRELNSASIPFRFKVRNEKGGYSRCDSGVLYLPKFECHRAQPLLERAYATIAPYLEPGTPVFTKHLGHGLGVAEEPESGLSFGLNRCRLVAEGLLRAHEQGKRTLKCRLHAIQDRFTEYGTTLVRPYLRPGSVDIYTFRIPSRTKATRSCAAPLDASGGCRETADTVGQLLRRSAIWYDGRCTWPGPLSSDVSKSDHGPLGPELYAGTSGIAIFLADLYRATGDRQIRQVANGAIGHALFRVESGALMSRMGLYDGVAGIAVAAARVGYACNMPGLVQRSIPLFEQVAARCGQGSEFDLISGAAGQIVALLAASREFGGDKWLASASIAGDQLLQCAKRSRHGTSWRTTNSSKECDLTGLSHGTAGIAYALLSLYASGGDSRYRQTAEEAIDYERHWFDSEAGNWPDLRRTSPKGARTAARKHVLPCLSYWCHGAPGIALSRLHAYQVLRDKRYEEEAIYALRSTRAAASVALRSGEANLSLCHGIAGIGDVLLTGVRRSTGDGIDIDGLNPVFELAGTLTRRLKKVNGRFFAEGSVTPGLMTGLAGMAHFCLRVVDPMLSSVLMIGADFVVPTVPFQHGGAQKDTQFQVPHKAHDDGSNYPELVQIRGSRRCRLDKSRR